MQNSSQVPNIPLHDIKPLLEIQEYSFYYLLALIAVGVVIVSAVVYLLYKFIQRRNRFNIRAEHLKLLNNLDLSDAKAAAYEITQLGATFKDDSERNLNAYETLVEHLENYKYKKNVSEFDEETKHLVERYRGMIDV